MKYAYIIFTDCLVLCFAIALYSCICAFIEKVFEKHIDYTRAKINKFRRKNNG